MIRKLKAKYSLIDANEWRREFVIFLDMYYGGLIANLIKSVLTDDLLRKNFLHHCYTSSEALYHFLGGKESGFKPMNMRVDGVSHWFLKKGDIILDPTVDQFESVPDYSGARGRGFLTKGPSKRARIIMERVMCG